jgi:hypothetical protein
MEGRTMRKLELLIEALEQDGHSKIRSTMKARDEKINRKSILKNILTSEEIDTVKKTLEVYKPPTPNSWAQVQATHVIKGTIRTFSMNRPYDYTELNNLTATLYKAGLPNAEIHHKIIKFAESIKKYENGGETI